MAKKNECYVDTSAFIAFLDKSDSFHPFFRQLFSSPPPLITSSLVIAEAHGWFLRRYDQHRAVQFLAFVGALPSLTIRGFDGSELPKAGSLVRKFLDQKLTLADAHGLAIMRESRIGCCWSTDRHLGLDGVPLVI
ncbi:MAG: PIN domain-containing protein [Bryobacteraceae bacterium]|jgi:predicted nucleic acid-binding protein